MTSGDAATRGAPVAVPIQPGDTMKTTMTMGRDRAEWSGCVGLAVWLAVAVGVAPWAASLTRAAEPSTVLSRAFEFRAVSGDPRANGETDFLGPTAVFSTDERVAFLMAYTDYAAAWFGDPQLNQLALTPEEVSAALARLKPQPLSCVRQTIPLNDGWKRMSRPSATPVNPARPWRVHPESLVIARGQYG